MYAILVGRSGRGIARSLALSLALAISPVLWLLTAACPAASADVGVVLNESLDENVDRISSTGHSAIYFSRICAESPVKLRLCKPGELGSVMSNYINIGEDQSFEWNVVPLSIYLYGVEDPSNRALFGSSKLKHLLEERYRERYLAGLCEGPSCRTSPKAEWREMVAATMIRGVYIFSVSTTLEQDEQFIDAFNDAANRNHFNGVTNNCADFTKRVINTYFPHAAKTDHLNDFGMTSPKAVVRTFTHFALNHPDSQLRVMHFAQQPGTFKRSRTVRSGTEQLFHSGRLMVPMVLASYYALPVVTTSYFTTGRFNTQKEFERHAATLDADTSSKLTPEQIAGTARQWKDFRKRLDSILAETEPPTESIEVGHFFKRLEEKGSPSLDDNGAAWFTESVNGQQNKVGVSASNILSPQSDPDLSRELLIARASHILKGAARSRETLPEFKEDWSALQRASVAAAARKDRSLLAGAQTASSPASGLRVSAED
jgi:hypothetical protein